jgi:hypothetical protein
MATYFMQLSKIQQFQDLYDLCKFDLLLKNK